MRVFVIDSAELLAVVVVVVVAIAIALCSADADAGVGSSFASLDFLPGFGSYQFLLVALVVIAAFALFSFHIDSIHLPLDVVN